MKTRGFKLLSVILTVFILVMLIMVAPANAFTLGIKIIDQFVQLGQKASLSVSANFAPNELVALNKLQVNLNGPENISCFFLPDGTKLSGCDNLTIVRTSTSNISSQYGYDAGYGYGYGYNFFGNGTLSFNITFNTQGHKAGVYTTEFIIYNGNNVVTKTGDSIFVIDSNALRGCSIRAHKGTFELGNTTINNSNANLNLFIPLKNAAGGTGELFVQAGKDRISYDFNVVGAIENNHNNALIVVSGTYKVGRVNVTHPEFSLISLDKKAKVINIAGKKITVSDMDVNLLTKSCL